MESLHRRALSSLVLAGLMAAPAMAATGSQARIDIEQLDRDEPGWSMVEVEGDASQGAATAQRLIWPMFYLHWRPLGEGEKSFKIEEARGAVEKLWPGLVIDGPLNGAPLEMPAHKAWLFEATLSHGEMKARYIVWSCPQSGRLMVADMTESLKVAAPPAIARWMEVIARSVTCHEGAASEASALAPVRIEVPDAKISLSRPDHWVPIDEYRIQSEFAGHDFTAQKPKPTAELGQYVLVPADAASRLRFSWGPIPDEPMSYNIHRQAIETYLSTRAGNFAILSMKAEGGLWITDGMARGGLHATAVPPTQMRSFRSWMWRAEGKAYFAVMELGGIHLGRRKITQEVKMKEQNFATAYKALLP